MKGRLDHIICVALHAWLITDTINQNQTAALNSARHSGGRQSTLYINQGQVITSQVIPKKRWKSHIQLLPLIGAHLCGILMDVFEVYDLLPSSTTASANNCGSIDSSLPVYLC